MNFSVEEGMTEIIEAGVTGSEVIGGLDFPFTLMLTRKS
jgi:hypothetical protein